MRATETVTRRPITPNRKVGDVLSEYPELLEVLVAQSPHFERLRNPILRRLHGKLVTLAQAAAIAGVDPAALVRALNAAVGQAPVDETFSIVTSAADKPEPAWVKHALVAARVDVREDQRTGADPFHRIMETVSKVQPGQVMVLRNTFEPLPLYDVLAKRGFAAWARRLAPEDWEVFFYRAAEGVSTPAVENAQDADFAWDAGAPAATVSIDVSELTPPQPMLRIMDALAQLQSGDVLLVHHKRRPVYLYPKLAELGHKHKTVERAPDQIDIYIRKA